eukprot:SAG11_NODE_10811_length_804_cov_0.817021_1_plen_77_part_00
MKAAESCMRTSSVVNCESLSQARSEISLSTSISGNHKQATKRPINQPTNKQLVLAFAMIVGGIREMLRNIRIQMRR